MRASPVLACSAALALVGAVPPSSAQTAAAAPPTSVLETWGFDPSVLVADGRELLLRAPDRAVDGVFQALLDSAQRPQQARAICMLFDPGADRSLTGLNAAGARLDPATRERYVLAIADLFVAATRHPPQPFDEAAARQALQQAGVRAAMLNDGFGAGLNGGDPAARCRSAAMLLEALAPRPLPERAAVTRLLLIEGWEQIARPAFADRS